MTRGRHIAICVAIAAAGTAFGIALGLPWWLAAPAAIIPTAIFGIAAAKEWRL